MKILNAIGAAVLAVATCFSARAEVVTTDLLNDAGTKIGYTVTGLGDDGNETAVVFTLDGVDHEWTAPMTLENVQFLVVGGGGGGAGGPYGAGGGGGGVVTGFVGNIRKDAVVKINVGSRGTRGSFTSAGKGTVGTRGGNSSLSVDNIVYITAVGGGYGSAQGSGSSGGSGGGGGGGSGSHAGGGVNNSDCVINAEYVTAWSFGQAGGKGYNSYSGGGGGGASPSEDGVGEDATKTQAGNGGAGLLSDITGDDVTYGSGGGGGMNQTGGGYSAGEGGEGAGNGGKGAHAGSAVANTGGGGGGTGTAWKRGGYGGSGIVVLRYKIQAGTAIIPSIAPKVYNGAFQVADIDDGEGYIVTENDGGIECGEYDVVLTLKDGYSWDEEGAANPLTLKFAITQAENTWTADPSISVSGWFKGDTEIGSITPAATQFGNVVVTITKDGEAYEGDYTNLSTFEAGSYVVTFAAPAECSNYTAITEEPTKTVSFIVYAADEVPEYTLTLGDMTVNADSSVSVPYSLACEVETEYVADVYAAYAIEGSDTTNTYALATDVALTSSGTGSIPDLKPGVNYYVSLYAIVEEEQSEPTTPVVIAIPGAATSLTASATFTNDPMKFIVSGSVAPGIGTTTVTVNWAINDTETLNNTTNFVFQYGDAGTFSFEIPYTSLTDKLTYDVSVKNTITAGDHGSFEWSDGIDAVTKTRTDSSNITYTWTGNGADNLWTNINNWSASKSPCFGYPDSSYAKVSIEKSCEIDLCGERYTIRDNDASALAFAENLDEVKFTNGSIYNPSSLEIGASGTKVVFNSVNFTGYSTFRPVSSAELVFSGVSDNKWRYRHWGNENSKISIINGEFSCTQTDDGYAGEDCSVIISNAYWKIDQMPKGTMTDYTYFYDGDTRQARIISEENVNLRNNYVIEIPEEGHAEATIETKTCSSTKYTSTFRLNVTNYKSGKPVPLVKCTSSTDQNLSLEKIKLVAYVVEDSENVTVTEKRNAKLVWSSEDNTLYYQQDSMEGFRVTIR